MTMKRTLLKKTLLSAAISALLCCTGALAQTLPAFSSVHTSGGTSLEQGLILKRDTAGNLYTAGPFSDPATFGSFTINAPVGTIGNYVAKQDKDGTYLWAKAYPKYSASQVDNWRIWIAVDSAGNVYTTGRLSGGSSLILGSTTLTAPNSPTDYSIFIAKQASDGTYTWAKLIAGGSSNNFPADIAADESGNVYVTGAFTATIDFDPGAGIANLAATNNLSMFVLKLDNAGNYAWAKAILPTTGSAANRAFPRSIAVDKSGAVYITGQIYIPGLTVGQYIDFDPGVGVTPLRPDGPLEDACFLSKLNASGDLVWAHQYANVDNGAYVRPSTIYIDRDDNIYATGLFQGSPDFDPGPGITTLTATGTHDAFISKFDPSGTLTWAKPIAGPGTAFIRGVQMDTAGNIYLAGAITGTADLDPGAGTADLVATVASSFIAKWNDQGDYVDAQLITNPSTGTSDGNGVAVNKAGTEVYLYGYFSGTTNFDPAGSNPVTSLGSSDNYLVKFFSSTLPITLSEFGATAKGLVAELRWSTGSESINKGFEVLRSTDGQSWQRIGYVVSQAAGGNSSTDLTYQFTDHSPAGGINYYRLKQEDLDGQSSLSPIRSVSFGSASTVKVYPNPTPGVLYVAGLKGGETISIYNTTGQLQGSQQVNNGGTQPLSIRSLAKGLYYIKVVNKKNVAQSFTISVE